MTYTKASHAELLAQLASLSSGPELIAFQSKVIPGIANMIGVRTPALRKIAKTLLKGDWRGFLAMDDHSHFELDMLAANIIANAKCDPDERFALIAQFLPHISNWAVCDMIGMDMKCARKYPAEFWTFIEPLWQCEHEFTLRFPIVLSLSQFLNDAYIERVLAHLLGVRSEAYYVRMALAWAYSCCFIEFADETLPLFERGDIADAWVHNKAIQKTRESRRVNAALKAHLSSLKR